MITPMKLNSFNGVGYGQKASVTLSVGPTYEEIILMTNLEPSMIKRVSVTLNAEEIYVLSGAQIKMLEAYKRNTAKSGAFVIPFSDISGKTANGIRSTALVTEMGDNILLEVEIGTPADMATATAISLQAWAHVSERQPARILVPKIKTQSFQATAQGENEFLNLISGAFISVRRMHFETDKMTDLRIERDHVKVYESSADLAKYQGDRNKRSWQAGFFHYDPLQRGFYLKDLFSTAHNSELKFTVTTTDPVGTLPILVESVEVVRPDLLVG